MRIEVIYALPDKVWRRTVEIEPGATAAAVYAASGLAADVVDDQTVRFGVFGRKVAGHHVMQRGERLELYRPLIADPKQRRRRRARGDE